MIQDRQLGFTIKVQSNLGGGGGWMMQDRQLGFTIKVQSNLGYPNSFVLRILYCVRISEFVQITEVVAKISRKRLVQKFTTFQLLLNTPNYSLMLDRSHSTR